MRITAISADITQVPCEAIVTAINSGGLWFGGLDGAIMRAAGPLYHQQAHAALPLKHGDTVVARGGGAKHRGQFAHVVFVIDDLCGPLREIVRRGLGAASQAGFASVCLPAIRMGVMLGQVEKSAAEAVEEMIEGLKAFLKETPQTPIKEITFVVYVDPDTLELLQQKITSLG